MAERIEVEIVANTSKFDEAMARATEKFKHFAQAVDVASALVRDDLDKMAKSLRDVAAASATLTQGLGSVAAAQQQVASGQQQVAAASAKMTHGLTLQRLAWSALTGVVTHWAVRASEALVGGFTGLIAGSVKLETAVANVGTLVGKTAADLAPLRAGIRLVSVEVGKTSEDIAKGVYDAVSSGVKLEDALQFTRVAAKAAAAGLADTATSIRALTVIQNTYGEDAGRVNEIADKLFQTVNIGVITFPELARNIGKAATTANLAGVEFSEFLGGIASLTRGGLTAASSMQGMNALINGLVHLAPKAAAAAERYGLNLSQARLQADGLVPIMRDLNARLGDNFDAWRQVFPSQLAARAAMILSKDAAKDLAESIDGISKSAGALDRAFDIQSKTVQVAFNRLRAVLAAKFDELFESASPALVTLLDDIRKRIANINAADLQRVIKQLLEVARIIGKIADGAAKAAGFIADIATGGVESGAGRSGIVVDAKGNVIRRDAGRGVVGGRGGAVDETLAARGAALEEALKSDAVNAVAEVFTKPDNKVVKAAERAAEALEKAIADEIQRLEKLAIDALSAGALTGPGGTGSLDEFIAAEQKKLREEQAKRIKEELTADLARRKEEFSQQMERLREEEARRTGGPERGQAIAAAGAAFAQGGAGGLLGLAGGALQGGLIQRGAANLATSSLFGGFGGSAIAGIGQFAGAALTGIAIQFGQKLISLLSSGTKEAFRASAKEATNELVTAAKNIARNLPELINLLVPIAVQIVKEVVPVILAEIPSIIAALVSAAIDAIPTLVPAIVEALGSGIAAMFERLLDTATLGISGLFSGSKEYEQFINSNDPRRQDYQFGVVPKSRGEGGLLGGIVGIRGYGGGGLVDSMQSMLQGFDIGGMVNGLAQQYGRGAVPVVAHQGEAIITRNAWSRIEALLEESVRAGVRGGGPSQFVVTVGGGGKYDRFIEKMIGEAVVTESRRQGSAARTMREVADGADSHMNLPILKAVT